MKPYGLALILFFHFNFIRSQAIEKDQQLWLGYLNSINFHRNWSFQSDINYRSGEKFIQSFRQTVLRGSVVYSTSKKLHYSMGYAYSFQQRNEKTSFIHEHRPWQQIHHFLSAEEIKFHHRLRLEERFRNFHANEVFTKQLIQFRLRHLICLQTPLLIINSKLLSMVIQNELMVQTTMHHSGLHFDQNRFFLGLNFALSSKTSIQPGYLFIVQQQDNPGNYNLNHCIRINIIQNFDLTD